MGLCICCVMDVGMSGFDSVQPDLRDDVEKLRQLVFSEDYRGAEFLAQGIYRRLKGFDDDCSE